MARWEPNARLRLVEAAVDLFGEQGYDATGVQQIAERAGLTKTTYFRHFADKREVLFAGQDEHVQTLAEAVAAAPAQASPLSVVAAALDALATSYPADRHAFAGRVMAVVAAHTDLQERAAAKRAATARALGDGLRARGVAGAQAVVAAELGMLAYTTAFAAWAADPQAPALADVVRQTLDELHAASVSLA